jgi:hypothetical protein
MSYFRRHRTFIGLFASVAILLGSVMPTISHVIASRLSNSSFLSEICTTSASKFVAFNVQPDKSGQNQGDKSMPMEHCPYCSTHAGSFGIIPHHTLGIYKLALSQPFPKLFYQAPYPLYAWISANPRAPPIFS